MAPLGVSFRTISAILSSCAFFALVESVPRTVDSAAVRRAFCAALGSSFGAVESLASG